MDDTTHDITKNEKKSVYGTGYRAPLTSAQCVSVYTDTENEHPGEEEAAASRTILTILTSVLPFCLGLHPSRLVRYYSRRFIIVPYWPILLLTTFLPPSFSSLGFLLLLLFLVWLLF